MHCRSLGVWYRRLLLAQVIMRGLSSLSMILKRPTLVSVEMRSGICCLDGVVIRRCYG